MFDVQEVLHPKVLEQPLHELWQRISALYSIDEEIWLTQLLQLAEPSSEQLKAATDKANELVEYVRFQQDAQSLFDALLQEYSLDTQEGILLMCLAEALIRVPDNETADAFIKDRLSNADWVAHAEHSSSFLVNASTWGLLLTGKIVTMDEDKNGRPASLLSRMINRVSEPVIRNAMHQAMKIMGHQFVLGRSISEALNRGKSYRDQGYTYSFDMLGEAALTATDAAYYLDAYMQAITSVGQDNYLKHHPQSHRPTISIKLSALHPRYEVGCEDRVMQELFNSVRQLIIHARKLQVGITIDAEEADRLELSLSLFEKLLRDECCRGWGELGLVVQAYSKRCLPVLTWLAALAQEVGDRIPLRLVKGAYWDTEIKLCQQRGLSGYPVYTRKEATDVSYLACAKFLLSEPIRRWILPQFATHNAHTIAAVTTLAESLGAAHDDFEFQRLHGMGDALYNRVVQTTETCVRIYAPVGSHKDLLPYLVRRLLENGANSSFVHRLVDATYPISELIEHPCTTLKRHKSLANPRIPLPRQLYSDRDNSYGPNINIASQWQPFKNTVDDFMGQATQWTAYPIINGSSQPSDTPNKVVSPYDHTLVAGEVHWATAQQVNDAIESAQQSYPNWSKTPVTERAECLERLADLMGQHYAELVALCHREAGKTIQDSIDEVREAMDFCHYYAQQATQHLSTDVEFTHYLGHPQRIQRVGRGVFACISPWNFPLAIFTGQIAAALVAGNTVVCKAAEQTSLIAYRAIQLFHEAGIPVGVLHFVPGDGAQIGAALTSHKHIAGVAFTGSTQTAQAINRTLAQRAVASVPVIAETGGLNAMIVDSTSLPEQVVRDAVRSAFASAGQRCSALRVMFVQTDIAEHVLTMLAGAMQELRVGFPYLQATDIGPVIDATAQTKLQAHIDKMKAEARLIAQSSLPEWAEQGTFVAPSAFEIEHIDQLQEEKFGPILHVIRYRAKDLDQVIDMINRSGYGLTLGIHSRNETTSAYIAAKVRVGNVYINRDQVGAVVGVQPFGGQGLSGTGPKAGGPHYLIRFTKEQWLSTQAHSERRSI